MKTALAFFLAALATQEGPISEAQFGALHRQIRPQPGESKWAQIPWLLSAWEARRRAAAEGKPILVWSGGGCPPLGTC